MPEKIDSNSGLSYCETVQADICNILGMKQRFNQIEQYQFDKGVMLYSLDVFIADKELMKIWTVLDNETLIGYVVLAFGFSFEYSGRDIFIDELYIEEAYRDRGIGRRS